MEEDSQAFVFLFDSRVDLQVSLTVEVTAQLGEITSQRPWLGSATLRDGKVCLEIAPLDVAIAELRLRPRG